MAPQAQPAMARRRRSAALAAGLACVALWKGCSTLGDAFAGAALRGPAPAVRSSVTRGAYAFDLATSEGHEGLVVDKQDGGVRVSTHGGLITGKWNTVLGDTEIPASGRSYFEVKIVKKPSDAWEYIGVAEAKADPSEPLTKNRKGAGWFMGATWRNSNLFTYMPIEKEYNEAYKKQSQTIIKTINEASVNGFSEKEVNAQVIAARDKMFTGVAGTHVGIAPNQLPPFKTGTVVGVDVDMDKGTLAFWVDGKYTGVMREMKGAVNLKGKKLVPAVSVYGRTTGAVNEFTIMEIRSGLEPPAMK
jgi:hypothetical protein